jgi:probable addiction module antidote protein
LLGIEKEQIMSRKNRSVPYSEVLYPRLREDPKYAAGYLTACLEGPEYVEEVFLQALRNVVEAMGMGMPELSALTHISREHLYTLLSEKGRPQFSNVHAILDSLGYALAVVPKDHIETVEQSAQKAQLTPCS